MSLDLRTFADAVRRPESDLDLGRAAFLIACIEHPGLDPSREAARLDELARMSGIAEIRGHASRVDRLRQFLFVEQQFRGNTEEYFDPRNSCLNDVLSRKLGIPITLSVVMMEVGRRVGVPVAGLGLPGHVIVMAGVGDDAVLIDPFDAGAVLDRDGASKVVARALGQPVELTDAHFAPIGKGQIVARMLANLKTIYIQREDWSKALAVIDRLLLLDLNPRDAVKLRDQLKQIRRALASLN